MNPSPLVRRFARNAQGRDLIIGDVHGFFSKLQAELDAVGFDPDAGDRLFSVGDLVDRGPESAQALQWLAQPWFQAVQGNHEDFAVRWPHGATIGGRFVRNMQAGHYAANGGAWNIAQTEEEQREFAAAFAELPIAIELETEAGLVAIVHADCPCSTWQDFTHALETGLVRHADGSLQASAREVKHLIDMAQWSRNRCDRLMDDGVAGVRAVVVGHTPMLSMTSLGNVLFIDTGGWLGRPFCIIDAKTLRPADRPSSLQC